MSGNTGHLDSLASTLRAVAQQIDGLSKADHADAGQFMQFDMAARYALAATHAISAADGGRETCAEQRDPVTRVERNVQRIKPELAEKLVGRIFAAGLGLTALQSALGDPWRDKVASIVEELDMVIREIRMGALE